MKLKMSFLGLTSCISWAQESSMVSSMVLDHMDTEYFHYDKNFIGQHYSRIHVDKNKMKFSPEI